MKVKVGFGYDMHRLESGQQLWLGGLLIPHEKGTVGHSDADVLIHAICDAILGAANLRDIGHHFSDTDPQYRGIDSKILLKETCKLVRDSGYVIGNIDTTICIERPKINPHVDEMVNTLAGVMEIDIDDISIKATTNERTGYVGREEGVNVYAVALLYRS